GRERDAGQVRRSDGGGLEIGPGNAEGRNFGPPGRLEWGSPQVRTRGGGGRGRGRAVDLWGTRRRRFGGRSEFGLRNRGPGALDEGDAGRGGWLVDGASGRGAGLEALAGGAPAGLPRVVQVGLGGRGA